MHDGHEIRLNSMRTDQKRSLWGNK